MKPIKKNKGNISIDNEEKITTAGRLQKFANLFKNEWHKVIIATIASEVSNVFYNGYGNTICQEFFTLLRNKSFEVHITNPDVFNNNAIINIKLPEPDMIASVEDLFRPLVPNIPDMILSEKLINKANEKSSKLEFTDDCKQKMFMICSDLQLLDSFDRTKVVRMVPFLKAIAFINGHQNVMVEDLRYIEMLSTSADDLADYSGIIDAHVNDYNAIASTHRGLVFKSMQTLESANNAVRQNKSINYFDNSIDPNLTIDDLIVKTLQIIAKSKSEIAALADGKSKNNTYYKPLFDLLEYLQECDRKIVSLKGIR